MSTTGGKIYLVTGGCGFLGKRLVRTLLEKEPDLAEVRVFDLHLDESMQQLDRGESCYILLQSRLTQLPLWNKSFKALSPNRSSLTFLIDLSHSVEVRGSGFQGETSMSPLPDCICAIRSSRSSVSWLSSTAASLEPESCNEWRVCMSDGFSSGGLGSLFWKTTAASACFEQLDILKCLKRRLLKS